MDHRYLCALLLAALSISLGCRPIEEPLPAPTAQEPAELRGELGPGNHVIIFDHDGRTRSYIAHVPEQLTVPAPVVVALHGGGGTGKAFQEANGLDSVSDREGFVVMYPEGTGLLPNRLHTWNSGDHCCGFAFDRSVDDVGFLRAAIADLGSRMTADPDRIYMTGHSNGAMMAYRFAVEASDVVAAIVPVGGAIDLAQPDPSEPIAMLHIHSIDDPRAVYDGGEGPAFPGTNRTVHHEPVLPGIQSWADAVGCTGGLETVETVTGDGTNQGQSYERIVWSGCPDSAAVEHLLLSGSGHGWPGVTEVQSIQRHLGPPTTLVNASEVVWEFVSQFAR